MVFILCSLVRPTFVRSLLGEESCLGMGRQQASCILGVGNPFGHVLLWVCVLVRTASADVGVNADGLLFLIEFTCLPPIGSDVLYVTIASSELLAA